MHELIAPLLRAVTLSPASSSRRVNSNRISTQHHCARGSYLPLSRPLILGMVLLWRFLVLVGLSTLHQALGQATWCGKNYKQGSPVIPPGGQFPIPSTFHTSLLAFRCAPIYKPYLEEDVSDGAGIIVDALVTYTQVSGAQPITVTEESDLLDVVISTGDIHLARAFVPLNASKFEIAFSLGHLAAQRTAYNVSCSASYANHQFFETSATLLYLPNPTNGSVTKMDSRTGALLNKAVGGISYASVFSLGFYTVFDNYLASNLSILDDLKNRGINIVHPIPSIPPFNTTALNAVLDRMDQLGLYLMYDMRWTYTNLTAVAEQVAAIKSRKSLLTFYTADEPDGWGDPLNATSLAYDVIYAGDGYHPVSLVLNCENYNFEQHTAGTDIVMQDTYVIGINATYSVVWNTSCTPDYGDCGCDNCVGEFEDISRRMDEFKERLWVLGWDRTKAVWTVPQAFGGTSYWSRIPTGREWIVQSILGINHGGLGVVPWDDPTSADIKTAATLLAQSLLPFLTKYFFDPKVVFSSYISNRIDVGLWTVGSSTLVVATNLNYNQVNLTLDVFGYGFGHVEQIMDSGAILSGLTTVIFDPVGSGAFILIN